MCKNKKCLKHQPAILLRLPKTAFWKYDHQGRSNVWLEDFPAIFGLAVDTMKEHRNQPKPTN